MQLRKLSHFPVLLVGIAIGCSVVPALCQQVGQKMFVGTNSQKEFETLSTDKKLVMINRKLDYLIQKSLPTGYYFDDNGVVQSALRSTTFGSRNSPAPTSGSVRLDSHGIPRLE